MNKTFEYKLQIKEGHLDTFGHMNNATYLSLFEEARWETITAGDFGLAKIKELKKGPVILEANVKFKREVLNREHVIIKTHIPMNKDKIITIHQEMVKEDGKVAAVADFVAGFMDLKLRKLIVPPKEWLEALGVDVD